MKLMFASDIHGSEYFCKKMLDQYKKEDADKLVLLGDILYHGPRNDLPKEYNPKAVIMMLNDIKEELLCVRGNCDTEVDQMVLDFPILADYAIVYLGNRMAYLTHGHVYNLDKLPPMKQGDLLIHGHTHVQAMEEKNGVIYINPGSVSIPKMDNKHSYMIYEDGTFVIKDLDGVEIRRFDI